MKICDRCDGIVAAYFTVKVVEDDASYDLCKKHKDEVSKLISTKEGARPLFGRKRKDSAKAG